MNCPTALVNGGFADEDRHSSVDVSRPSDSDSNGWLQLSVHPTWTPSPGSFLLAGVA
jgi:hypothetical protein